MLFGDRRDHHCAMPAMLHLIVRLRIGFQRPRALLRKRSGIVVQERAFIAALDYIDVAWAARIPLTERMRVIRLLYTLIAQLHDAVQVLQRLLLRVLRFAELFDQVLFNALQLLHLGVNVIDWLLARLFLLRIQTRGLLLLLSLGKCLVLQELSLMLLNLLCPVSFEI